MIELFTSPTPNGHKVSIALEDGTKTPFSSAELSGWLVDGREVSFDGDSEHEGGNHGAHRKAVSR